MVDIVSDFRLQTLRTAPLLTLVTAAIILAFGVPGLIAAGLSGNARPAKDVIITDESLDFSVTVDGLNCPVYVNSTLNQGWLCDEATVEYSAYEDVADHDLAVRRAVRFASSSSYLPEDASLTGPNALFSADPYTDTLAIGIEDPSGNTRDLYIVTINGTREQAYAVARRIWRASTGQDLPGGARAALEVFTPGKPYEEVAVA